MLAADRILDFEKNGFLIIDLEVDENILDKAIAEIVPLYKINTSKYQYRNGTRIQDGWKSSSAVLNLMLYFLRFIILSSCISCSKNARRS